MSKSAVKEKVSTRSEVAMVTSASGSAYLRKEEGVVDERTTDAPSLQNISTCIKLGRQLTRAPLAAAISAFIF